MPKYLVRRTNARGYWSKRLRWTLPDTQLRQERWTIMTKCRICGAVARREGESGDEIIYLKCSNGHTFQTRTRDGKLRKRTQHRKRENELYADLRTLHL